MRITIDLDSTTGAGATSMQGSTYSHAEPVSAPSLVLSQAMDAGSYKGNGTAVGSPIDPSPNFEAGAAGVAPTRPPTSHRDTFTLGAPQR